MVNLPSIALVLSDVDGTLVTKEKVLTERAREAVDRLRAAGILFAVVSGRPPRGMEMLIEPLRLDTPIAGFNGGVFVDRDLAVLQRETLPAEMAVEAVELMREHELDPWVYDGDDWLVTRPEGPHVRREAATVRFEPEVTADLASRVDQVAKIVGVSDDVDAVRRCEAASRELLGPRVSASRSQPYYLDITHPHANKGAVLEYLSRTLDIPAKAIATIGDGPNDVLMFRRSGFSIAMGNAADEVKASAGVVTDSLEDEGFAKAMERYILDPARGGRP